MLTTLRIKNLALVTDLTIEFQPGLNVITGETGAGKSILIGALNLALGERADRTLIRSGADTCAVEAIFHIAAVAAPVQRFLEESGLEPCDQDQLIIKRSFGDNGTNRQFINGSAATLATLTTLGQWLVDVHGAHEHQSLLKPARQLALLDAFAGVGATQRQFGDLVRRREQLEGEKSALIVDEKTYAQQLDLLRHQVAEIASATLSAGEDVELEQQHRLAGNAARLIELSQTALGQLNADENSLTAQSGSLGRTLQELKRLDPEAGCLFSLLEQANSFLRDLQTDLSHYSDKLDFEPSRLQQLEERLNLLHSLKRKYGATLDEVIGFGDQARLRLEALERRDADLARLDAEIGKINTELLRVGRELSEARRKVVPALAKAVSRQLADLGFHQSLFDIRIETTLPAADGKPESRPRISVTGFDTIEFVFAPNPGEPPQPLRSIASSGEMARVMLALKTVLATQDDVAVLVFDEVDANVGGETAAAVGEKMRALGRHRQVFCITHLAQVAACAAAHFAVSKKTRLLRTVTQVEPLDPEARVTELARMLGGQSNASRQHAAALLRSSSSA